MQEFEFYSPRSLEGVCQALADPGGRLIAGGTDVIPQMRDGRFRARRLIDLTRQPDLRFIEGHNGRVHISALTTYAQMIASFLLQTEAPALWSRHHLWSAQYKHGIGARWAAISAMHPQRAARCHR
jgi:CO/xanthine dehydrogenase FAD-binding subunit